MRDYERRELERLERERDCHRLNAKKESRYQHLTDIFEDEQEMKLFNVAM